MSKKNILLILIVFFCVIIAVILFLQKKSNSSLTFSNVPEALEPNSKKDVIANLCINKKDVIYNNIEKVLNNSYKDYISYGGNFSDYFSNYTDDFKIDFGSISNVNSLVNDTLYESVDYFEPNGELIESFDDLPDIKYKNKKVNISENTLNLEKNSYYLIRYFDNSSLYALYFTVYLSENSDFSIGDIWIVSINESYYDDNIEEL